jgi:nonsense-mediated mRNA decay protein 3
VELAPICKDDLVCLPPKVATSLGGIGPVVLCTRVTNSLTFIDTRTLQTASIEAPMFWRQPFRYLMSSRQLTEFIVLDIEPLTAKGCHHHGKFCLAECEVARLSDFGSNDQTYMTVTHLGHILHAGDHVLGYDVANANLVDMHLENAEQKGFQIMDIVLVRKSYEEKRRQKRASGASRAWKLKRMAAEYEEDQQTGGKHRNGQLVAEEQDAADMERFLEELEEDPDMRSRVAIYRSSNPEHHHEPMQHDDDDSDGDLPEIPLEELLDDLAAMQIEEESREG